MAEWFKAAVLKTAVGVSLPWVRIPLSPPELQLSPCFQGLFCVRVILYTILSHTCASIHSAQHHDVAIGLIAEVRQSPDLFGGAWVRSRLLLTFRCSVSGKLQ